MLTRRVFLGALAKAGLAAPARRRSVLFMASDDLNTCLSAYGHPLVKTPNIDRIARAGVRFDRAYCQFPLCSPSRTSLLTGLAPDTTTVYDLQKHFRSVIPEVTTLPQLFRKNGYVAKRVGKIFHYGVPGQIGTDGLDDKPSWDAVVNPCGVDHLKEEPALTNYTPTRGLGSAICFYDSPARDEEHTDGIGASEVIRLLEQHRGDPFFIAAGFYRPHVPWIAPRKYFDRIRLQDVRLIPFEESEMHIAPELAYFTRPGNWGMSEKQRRDAMRAYYASILFLDAQVGRVLDALNRLGLSENTTIVFWSDHGYQLGEHGQWMKQTLFEPAARVPLMIAGPDVRARGRACPRTVEFLDLYPTLAELCGLSGAPAGLHGASLRPWLGDPQAPRERPAVTQVRRGNDRKAVMGYSLRTPRHRYTMWADGAQGEELYDYRADPREMKNLAQSAAAAATKADLRARLDAVLQARGKGRQSGDALRRAQPVERDLAAD
jgi:uncharacterized sulfatase